MPDPKSQVEQITIALIYKFMDDMDAEAKEPLDFQQQIVAEIEGYQKIIDGARQVLNNYKPSVVVSPEWPVVRIGDIFKTRSGTTHCVTTLLFLKEGKYRG